MEAIAILFVIGAILVVAVIVLGIFFLTSRTWIKVAAADEALIVSAKKKGESQVIVHGKAVVMPITQTHQKISLRSRQVNMQVTAQSDDNVTLNVEAVALVKIGSEAEFIRRAAQRFASSDKEIVRFTQDQLEGVLRGVVAQQTVTSLMRERKKFSEQIAETVIPELEKQGLILDSFQICGITDDVGYIKSLGAPEIQAKKQAAEIAETEAARAIAKSRIANQEADLVEQTQLDANKAAADAQVGEARAQAMQAERLADEKARLEVLRQQAENKQIELEAEVNKVADAERYRRKQEVEADTFEQTRRAQAQVEIAEAEATAAKVRAMAEAEAVRLKGQAEADAIKAKAEAYRENQEALLAQQAMEILPELMSNFASGYANIGSMTVLSGGEGSENSVGSRFAGEQALGLKSIIESVKQTTGIDLAEIIQGRAAGHAQGSAQGAAIAEALSRDETVEDRSEK